ncbi:MAG: filamentous hemagglutinin N-terminal domain-containing protein, partial [Candidatus Pacebacteria bacterium]|nr:filamentous hemagglutinin N-terminal domain-containing protein [Candidatus Paceibacterota bacterium]
MLAIISSRSLFLRNKPVARLVGSAAVAAILSLTPNQASAAPQGGTIASGAAIISTGASSTIVTQSSDRAVIDWQSFNLAANESVEFKVPTNTSATLNRINDSRPSTISGSITSNGAVYFTNPNGLIFDANSSVTANGFFAATKHLNPSQFMAGGAAPTTLSGLGNRSVVLDGIITAPSVTAFGGTVTVNGTIEAVRGNVLLSSTNLTTIGEGAVIRVDAESNGNGGRAIIWSDNHTDFHGFISAQGGTTSGDGGFVEVSGKNTLNYTGMVNTLASHGKTGTLLLDPTDITISSGTNSATNSAGTITGTGTASIVNITTLQTALATNNVIINANAGTGTGSGKITVAEAVTWSSNSNLTLTGTAIEINASITNSGTGTLALNASINSILQDPSTVITAGTVSGSSAGGIYLIGTNLISNLGTMSNSGHGGIAVKNAKALAIASGITLNGGKGGVSILNSGFDVTLNGALTVRGSFLRLDMGANNLKSSTGTQTITANGMDLYYTSATTGNAGTLTLGTGNFVFVTDNRSTTTATTIDNSTTLPTAFTIAGSGLTVTAASTNGQGLVYGGAVDIRGISSGVAKDLRYIEGTKITVTNAASAFTGSLTLVASGSSDTHALENYGIKITQNLTAGTAGDGVSNLNIIQSGALKTVTTDDYIRSYGMEFYSGGRDGSGNLIPVNITAGGAMSLSVTGKIETTSSNGFNIAGGIHTFAGKFTAGRDLSMVQSGVVGTAIDLSYAKVNAGGDVSLISHYSNAVLGAYFGSNTNEDVVVAAANTGLVLVKTNNSNFKINIDNSSGQSYLKVTSGKLRIDLGTKG